MADATYAPAIEVVTHYRHPHDGVAVCGARLVPDHLAPADDGLRSPDLEPQTFYDYTAMRWCAECVAIVDGEDAL